MDVDKFGGNDAVRDSLTPSAVSQAIRLSLEGRDSNEESKWESRGESNEESRGEKEKKSDELQLQRICWRHFGKEGVNGVSVSEMQSALFDVLISSKGDDAIQNEVGV